MCAPSWERMVWHPCQTYRLLSVCFYPWNSGQGWSLFQGWGAPLSSLHYQSPPLFFKNAFPQNIKQIQHCSGFYKANGFWRTVCLVITQGERISFRRYYRTISAFSKKSMMPNTRKNTANTGSSTSRRQSSASLNVGTTLKIVLIFSTIF
jgi:hypothetical protein